MQYDPDSTYHAALVKAYGKKKALEIIKKIGKWPTTEDIRQLCKTVKNTKTGLSTAKSVTTAKKH